MTVNDSSKDNTKYYQSKSYQKIRFIKIPDLILAMSFFTFIPALQGKEKEIRPRQETVAPPTSNNSFLVKAAPKIDIPVKKQEKVQEKLNMETSDITFIDSQIKERLSSKIETISELQEELLRMEWIEANGIDELDKSNARLQTIDIRKKIQDIELGAELGLYMFRSSQLIESYKELEGQLKKNSFVIRATRDEGKIKAINQIKLEYLRIAKEYIDIESFKQKPQKLVCNSCKSDDLSPSENDSSILTCKCGNVIEILDDAPSFKDSERVNMASRYTYTCKGHFIEAMNRFEGKQNVEIKPEVISTLKKQIMLHKLTKDTATKDHIYMFLSENKFSDYYADINLIYFMITNVNPPDITEYRNELLEMHDQIEEAYNEVKDKERLNSLNVNWKLYKLLQIIDYPCKKDDFFCLKTPAKQGEHEQKWHDMIEYLKTKYPSALTSKGKKRWRHMKTL